MFKNKKILVGILVTIIIVATSWWVWNNKMQPNPPGEINTGNSEINFFYKSTCPFCKNEKAFLEELEKKYPGIKINKYEVSSQDSQSLLKDFFNKYRVPEDKQGYIPVTFITEEYFIGFNEEIGQKIEAYFK